MASRTAREEEVRELLAKQSASGLSQRAFAASLGMPAGTLAWWKREIARRDRARTAPVPAAPTFLPVEITADARALHGADAPLVLHVADVRIDVAVDVDLEHLRRVLAVVRSC